MNKLNKEEIEFIIKFLKKGKPLPDSYRYIIPFETKKAPDFPKDGYEQR
ncbi:hypothetical protein ES708_28947 [subsurface metagenome]